jgi:light-regulated signal transduction histidine kinase (bacteriophytochrome)
LKKKEIWLLRNLEGLLILVILISVMLINFFIYSKVAFLNFYYLPVIVGGYYLGRRMAVLGAFFAILMVSVFVLANQETYLLQSTKFDLYFNLIVWAGFLMITGWIIGFLSEKLREDLDNSNKLRMELERSNQDLEDFAFTASHDLQEPLRKIHVFGDLLKQTSGKLLDPKSKQHMNRMLASSERAQTYLSDLLSYSQIRSKARPTAPVNLNELIKEVLVHFNLAINKLGARVETGTLPTVMGDQYMMRQLFQNLIGNALKFAKAGQSPRIKIYSRPNDNGFFELVVQDEGIGFNTSYLNNMFKPFKKLHSKDQYEGGGMGLTICMKVVRVHGGQLTANSKLGKGAQFIIHLPKNSGKG